MRCAASGYVHVAGCDEVGRGCLAGPVVAAAVVLHPRPPLSPASATPRPCPRPNASASTTRSCARHSPGPSARPIRPKSIASTSTRRRCARCSGPCCGLSPLPDIVLVDAFRVPDLPMAQRGVVHGDRRCSAIAAASIVAKVTRDSQMLDLHGRDPRYGFDRHKGYAPPITSRRFALLRLLGCATADRSARRRCFDTIE